LHPGIFNAEFPVKNIVLYPKSKYLRKSGL